MAVPQIMDILAAWVRGGGPGHLRHHRGSECVASQHLQEAPGRHRRRRRQRWVCNATATRRPKTLHLQRRRPRGKLQTQHHAARNRPSSCHRRASAASSPEGSAARRGRGWHLDSGAGRQRCTQYSGRRNPARS